MCGVPNAYIFFVYHLLRLDNHHLLGLLAMSSSLGVVFRSLLLDTISHYVFSSLNACSVEDICVRSDGGGDGG